jgi:hypothetical protein
VCVYACVCTCAVIVFVCVPEMCILCMGCAFECTVEYSFYILYVP